MTQGWGTRSAAGVVMISVVALVIWLVVPGGLSAPSAGPAATTTTSTSTTPTLSVPRPVSQSQLTGFLLSLDDVRRLANAPNDYKTTDSTSLNGSEGITVTRGNRNPSIVLVSSTMANSPLFVSTRVVAAKANVVVDLALMGADLGESAQSIALEILSRIPA